MAAKSTMQQKDQWIMSKPPSRFALAVLLGVGTIAAPAAAQPSPAQTAKVSLNEARAIALKLYASKIMKEELEREAGALRYSFDIRRGKRWREIGVDAMTGKVVENIAEHAYPKD
jgi:uncharacterized membrane protein YkoI